MEQDELLRVVVGALEDLEIRYLVTGSIATIFYGEPRFTNDIDIVVNLDEAAVDPLLERFPAPDYYVSGEAARTAVARATQFNLIHPASGLKVDFMVAADTEFNASRFARGLLQEGGPDFKATFAAPEDVILMKLRYLKEGGSEKHFRDILGIFKVSGRDLDRRYLQSWAERLDIRELWQGVAAAAGSED